MRGLPSILSLFRDEIYKFNNTGARMLDSIYHITLKFLKNHVLGVKTARFCNLLRNVIIFFITYALICEPLVCYPFYCMAFFHSQTRRHMII